MVANGVFPTVPIFLSQPSSRAFCQISSGDMGVPHCDSTSTHRSVKVYFFFHGDSIYSVICFFYIFDYQFFNLVFFVIGKIGFEGEFYRLIHISKTTF